MKSSLKNQWHPSHNWKNSFKNFLMIFFMYSIQAIIGRTAKYSLPQGWGRTPPDYTKPIFHSILQSEKHLLSSFTFLSQICILLSKRLFLIFWKLSWLDCYSPSSSETLCVWFFCFFFFCFCFLLFAQNCIWVDSRYFAINPHSSPMNGVWQVWNWVMKGEEFDQCHSQTNGKSGVGARFVRVRSLHPN